jgi:hypothetical protein
MSILSYTKIPDFQASGKAFNPNNIVASYQGWMAAIPGLNINRVLSTLFASGVVTCTTSIPNSIVPTPSPGSVLFLGYISGTTLTVTGTMTLTAGTVLSAPNLAANTVITTTNTGTTFTVNNTQTLGSSGNGQVVFQAGPINQGFLMTGVAPVGYNGCFQAYSQAVVQGYISGTTLTVTSTTSGTVAAGQLIQGSGAVVGQTVISGAGPYVVSVSQNLGTV